MPDIGPVETTRAEYWTNIWFRDRRGYEPDTFTARQDAIENVAEPLDGWSYVETIWRKEDGVCEIVSLSDDAVTWLHSQMEPCEDLARLNGCSCRLEIGVPYPEAIISHNCPLHGQDPDQARDERLFTIADEKNERRMA